MNGYFLKTFYLDKSTYYLKVCNQSKRLLECSTYFVVNRKDYQIAFQISHYRASISNVSCIQYRLFNCNIVHPNISCAMHPISHVSCIQYYMYRASNITYSVHRISRTVHHLMSLQWTNNKLSNSVPVRRGNLDSVSQNNEQSVCSRRTDIQQ